MKNRKIEVKDVHKSTISGLIFGYCSCGREVKLPENECPLCKNELIWTDFEDEKVGIL